LLITMMSLILMDLFKIISHKGDSQTYLQPTRSSHSLKE
jgi:hypothetical protein